jgi:molybdenum-dependent DNA-binding transcriptional regulator ModE
MALPLTIDEALFEWCTPRQREVLEAVNLHGSAKAASIALGINQGAASDAFIAVKKRRLVQDMPPLMTSLGQCQTAM